MKGRALLLFILLFGAVWVSLAQEATPAPAPTIAIDIFGAQKPQDIQSATEKLRQIGLKEHELPGGGALNKANRDNRVLAVDQLVNFWPGRMPDPLPTAYINGGVLAVELSEFGAADCTLLQVYGLGSFVRAMIDENSAQAFVVDVTVPSLYERLLGWTQIRDSSFAEGNLYTIDKNFFVSCGADDVGYLYEYAYGPYVVGLIVHMPASTPLATVESVLTQLMPVLNGRIDTVEGRSFQRQEPTALPTLAVTATPSRDLSIIPTVPSTGLAQAYFLQPEGLQSFNAMGGITNPGLVVQNPADSSRYLITDALGLLFTMKGQSPARITVSPFNDFIPSTRDNNQDIVVEAVWSPDGQYVAFVMDTTGNPDQSRTPDDGVWFFQPEVNWPMQYLISCPPGCGIVTRGGEPQEYRALSAVWSPDSQYLLINLDLPIFARGGFMVIERTFNEGIRHVRPPAYYYDHADWGIDGRIVVSGRAPGNDPEKPQESNRVILGTVNRDGSGEQIVLDGSAKGLWLAYGTQRPQDDQPYAGEYLALGKPGGADGPMWIYNQNGDQITQVAIGQTRPAYVRWNTNRTAVYVRTQEGRKFIAKITGEIIEITSAVGSVSAVGWSTGWQPPAVE